MAIHVDTCPLTTPKVYCQLVLQVSYPTSSKPTIQHQLTMTGKSTVVTAKRVTRSIRGWIQRYQVRPRFQRSNDKGTQLRIIFMAWIDHLSHEAFCFVVLLHCHLPISNPRLSIDDLHDPRVRLDDKVQSSGRCLRSDAEIWSRSSRTVQDEQEQSQWIFGHGCVEGDER
jgi:hypothetical protein